MNKKTWSSGSFYPTFLKWKMYVKSSLQNGWKQRHPGSSWGGVLDPTLESPQRSKSPTGQPVLIKHSEYLATRWLKGPQGLRLSVRRVHTPWLCNRGSFSKCLPDSGCHTPRSTDPDPVSSAENESVSLCAPIVSITFHSNELQICLLRCTVNYLPICFHIPRTSHSVSSSAGARWIFTMV